MLYRIRAQLRWCLWLVECILCCIHCRECISNISKQSSLCLAQCTPQLSISTLYNITCTIPATKLSDADVNQLSYRRVISTGRFSNIVTINQAYCPCCN